MAALGIALTLRHAGGTLRTAAACGALGVTLGALLLLAARARLAPAPAAI
ncbi:hypothetical protein [Kitasatospora sp. MMS16-BH015]|nr:hypothetical protein [Kitasatospora sp. MMS16-BH015]